MSPTSSWKKASVKSKERAKSVKRTFYESPLKHIQLSSKRWEQIQTQRRLMHKAKLAVKEKQCFFPSLKDSAFQDSSIIVLSDNESELDNEEDENICRNNAKARKRCLETQAEEKLTVQYSLHSSKKSLNQGETILKPRPCKKRKMDATVLLDSSCLVVSDTEDAEITTVEIDDEIDNETDDESIGKETDDENVGKETDDENIASSGSVSQGVDDIVVVWSSTRKSSPTKDQPSEKETEHKAKQKETAERCKEKKPAKRSKEKETVNQDEDVRVFMVDCNPTPQYLNCLSNEDPMTQTSERNISKMDEKEDSDLPFNKPGLVLPTAHNISKDIVMKRGRSSTYALAHLQRQALRYPAAIQPSVNSYPPLENATPLGYVTPLEPSERLREIIIDGNNVAMAHKNHHVFSEEGLLIVINYFQQRGHSVKVFIPQCRRSISRPLLEKWYNEGIVVFTPSRYIGGRWITSYDDRFILQYATLCGGIVISSDQYRDLYKEKPEWRNTIMNRLLAPTFVGNIVMFPEDPLGRNGPKLDEFLKY
ncbi:uncharacterized protein LOC143372443 isoform X2 [Andrena cerasifolii]|uniref:uncharacterized protein LOC143372443 isoform X2 n=1 Tax=Andrena cerasifolii TaxID=2819439 RepID=UPI0040380A28